MWASWVEGAAFIAAVPGLQFPPGYGEALRDRLVGIGCSPEKVRNAARSL